jgi:hypothetical protein
LFTALIGGSALLYQSSGSEHNRDRDHEQEQEQEHEEINYKRRFEQELYLAEKSSLPFGYDPRYVSKHAGHNKCFQLNVNLFSNLTDHELPDQTAREVEEHRIRHERIVCAKEDLNARYSAPKEEPRPQDTFGAVGGVKAEARGELAYTLYSFIFFSSDCQGNFLFVTVFYFFSSLRCHRSSNTAAVTQERDQKLESDVLAGPQSGTPRSSLSLFFSLSY